MGFSIYMHSLGFLINDPVDQAARTLASHFRLSQHPSHT